MSKTVEKALHVLCSFSGDVQEYGLSEIAQSLGYDKATLLRLLKSLEQYHFVIVNPRTRKYRLGPRILELASRFNFRRDLRTIALPEMVRLRNRINETVGISFPLENGRVCVDQVETSEHVRAVMPIGLVLPYHAGSVGRVMLAYKPKRELERIVSQPLVKFNPTTIVDPEQLRENLRTVRRLGYALSYGERLTGSCGLSVPILNHQEELLAALTVIGPFSRMTPERAVEKLPYLLETVSRIKSELFGAQTAYQ